MNQRINDADLKRLETLFIDRFITLSSTYKPNKNTIQRLSKLGFLDNLGGLTQEGIQEVLNKTSWKMVMARKRGNIREILKEHGKWIIASQDDVNEFSNLVLKHEKDGRLTMTATGETYMFCYKEEKQ